ncbi:DUF4249 domain-containing protein [Gaoshiqia sediminis]|uniref:DUF4249 domain-containing protein n=1 Tax=Gaoshiqia sediminis TaxID=2986998 RepID=A0AA41Y448_9BACT|nr:DUF4249 domain-containing protein [Gaoshiqia sediminis]MCW0481539.1 DUF4249 domain-containing protein [Gaoshiqia sediminis]
MKYLKYFFPAVLAALFSACTERVEIDLKEAGEPKLVVFAEITNERKAHALYLSRSVPYFYNQEGPVVAGATVRISDGTNTTQLTEDITQPGVYLTPEDFAGIPGFTYRLTIEDVDVNDDGIAETYSAETEMKNTVPVEHITVIYNSRWDGWEVKLYALEPGETTDYYLFKVYKNGVLYTDTIDNYWTTDDKFFNGNKIDGPIVQYFDEEKGEIVNPGDMVTLEMAGITKEYYEFINALQQEVNEKIPLFSGPAANLKGNISNGALGFFAVMPTSRGSTVYRGEGLPQAVTVTNN